MGKQQKQTIQGTYGPVKLSAARELPLDWEFLVANGDVKRPDIMTTLEITLSASGYVAKTTYFAPDLKQQQAGGTEIYETSKIRYGLSKKQAKNLAAHFMSEPAVADPSYIMQ